MELLQLLQSDPDLALYVVKNFQVVGTQPTFLAMF